MDSLVFALRYRDVLEKIDTINEHKDIIENSGSVLWGWWKKDFEEDIGDDQLILLENCNCLLVDRAKGRAYSASILKYRPGKKLSESEVGLVPAYYREHRDEVHAWFEVQEITEVHFDLELARDFGDRTFLWTGQEATNDNAQIVSSVPNGDCVLHLSDLHFGADFGFIAHGEKRNIGDPRVSLVQSIKADLERTGQFNQVGAIILSGDIITHGDWNDGTRNQALVEITTLCKELNVTRDRLFLLPGNHDVERYPVDSNIDANDLAIQNQTSYKHEREFRTFVDELTGRNWKETLNYNAIVPLKNCDLVLSMLNSCTILATEWTEYGYVGDGGVRTIREAKGMRGSRATYKVLAMHHHLLPVNTVATPNSKGVTLALDAPKILSEARDAGFQVALHGHEHQPRISRYYTYPLGDDNDAGEIVIISNGSAGAKVDRLPGSERNIYGIYDFSKDELKISLRELRPDGKNGSALFDGVVNIKPLEAI